MPAWSAEIIVRKAGKSYTQPPLFVSVEAGTWYAAVGAAAREGHSRLASLYPRIRIEMVAIKVHRLDESSNH